MKSAKEMFEKLEFTKEKENRCFIQYENKKMSRYIEFISNISDSCHQITCYHKGLIFKTNIHLTLEELQAINKQVEELGWK